MSYVVKERVSGVFKGKQVRFSRVWGGHRFTDEECDALLAGDSIHFPAVSKAGNKYEAYGYLAEQVFVNNLGEKIPFFGFKLDFDVAPEDVIPWVFLGHQFTESERAFLATGQPLHVTDLTSKRTGNVFEADLVWGDDAERPGRKRINLSFE